MTLPVAHLYVHVPFCAAKCHYCAFYSRPGTFEQMTGYVDAVLTELKQHAATLTPSTIFFGGGTPSLLSVRLWQHLLGEMRQCLAPLDILEWTIECNPSTVDREKAALWRTAGINRISLGVQSFEDRLLRVLGRLHTAQQAVETYRLLRADGFDNLNLDLMFGLPGQTLDDWRDTLRQAVALVPEHIATYCLTAEEGTALAGLAPEEERSLAMYEMTMEQLTAAGYRHYEISNFAQPGYECAHNVACWEGKDYLGLGPSACSTVGNRRWQNVADTGRYIEAVRHQQAIIGFEETLSPELRQTERVAFGLRMTNGVPASWVRDRWRVEIAGLLRDGLVCWREERLQLTRRGLRFADEVAAAFV